MAAGAAFFFAAGDLDVDFFLVTPADLVRGPGPLVVVVVFFLAGEGAAGLGALALASSCGGGWVSWVISMDWLSEGVDGRSFAYDGLDALAWLAFGSGSAAGGAGFGHDGCLI